MEENSYCVYMHTLRADGRKYIGITRRKPEYRWNNGKGYKKSTYFYNAIKKYGWDAFKHEILFENLSEGHACLKEQALIKLFNTTDKHFGFNLTTGGEKHYQLTNNIKEKLSKNCTKWDLDTNVLYYLYMELNYSSAKIADMLNVPVHVVKSRLYRLGVRKTPAQRKQLSSTNNKKYNIDFNKLRELLLVENKSYKECAEYFNCSIGVIKVYASEYGFKKTKEQTVEVIRRTRHKWPK